MNVSIESQSYKAGERAGGHWAEHSASPDEMERLEAFHDRCLEGLASFARWFDLELCAPWSHADLIAAAIMGFDEDAHLHAEAVEFAETLFGGDGDETSDEFLCGFVCGALDPLAD